MAATDIGGTIEVREALSPQQVQEAASLIDEYARELGLDLSFQSYAEELASLPGKYAPPTGTLLLAYDTAPGASKAAIGCVAVRPIQGERTCEMKRLYVAPAHRGARIARRLVMSAIARARAMNYASMLLDTLDSMHGARALYASVGFRERSAYYQTPLVNTVFYELTL